MRKILAILTSMILVACNSGGTSLENTNTQDTKPPQNQVHKYMGLDNLGNSCYINSALQLIINNPELRKEITGKFPTTNQNAQNFLTLFDAYDSKDSNKLKQVHKVITAYINNLQDMPAAGQTGAAIEVFSGDYLSYHGLNINSRVINSENHNQLQNEITSKLNAGIKVFSFMNNTSNYPTIKYADIPFKDKLFGVSYNSGGHYITYIKQDNIWYKLNDHIVSQVNETELNNLPLTNQIGIEVVNYK